MQPRHGIATASNTLGNFLPSRLCAESSVFFCFHVYHHEDKGLWCFQNFSRPNNIRSLVAGRADASGEPGRQRLMMARPGGSFSGSERQYFIETQMALAGCNRSIRGCKGLTMSRDAYNNMLESDTLASLCRPPSRRDPPLSSSLF